MFYFCTDELRKYMAQDTTLSQTSNAFLYSAVTKVDLHCSKLKVSQYHSYGFHQSRYQSSFQHVALSTLLASESKTSCMQLVLMENADDFFKMQSIYMQYVS